MKFVLYTCSLVAIVLTGLGASSCTAMNSIDNAIQAKEIDDLQDRLLVLECRHISKLQRAQPLLERLGEDLAIRYSDLGFEGFGVRVSDQYVWLIPAEDEWSILRLLAASGSKLKRERLGWKCAAELCRKGQIVDQESKILLSRVPSGSYDLFLGWRDKDDVTGRVRYDLYSRVEVSNEGNVGCTQLEKIPKGRKGLLAVQDKI